MRRAPLTFERIGRGAYEGFTLAEARAIVENPDQLAHLALLWQLRPPPASISANSVVDDPSGRWHRELQRRTQQPDPRAGRLRAIRARAGGGRSAPAAVDGGERCWSRRASPPPWWQRSWSA